MCPSSSGDRASASGAESRRFESYLGHHSDFPRTRMMRVFFFRQEIAAASLLSPNTPQRYRAKKRARMRTRLGGACIPSAQCIVANHTQLTRAAVSAAFVFSTNLRRLSPPCARAHQSDIKRHQATSSDIKRQAYFAKRLAASSIAMFTIASAANHMPSAEVSMLT